MSKQNSRKKSTRDSKKKPARKAKKQSAEPTGKISGWGVAGIALAIAAIAFIVYGSTLDYDLVYCDDNKLILDDLKLNTDADNFSDAFDRTIGASYYRPILRISFVTDAQIGEKFVADALDRDPGKTYWLSKLLYPIHKKIYLAANPKVDFDSQVASGPNRSPWLTGATDAGFYRITNLLLHALGSALLFILLLRLGYSPLPSFILSALFAAHPILTPAVAWISGRNDSLLGVFAFMSFIFLTLAFDVKKIYSWIFIIPHLFFFWLALYTKEIASMLPAAGLAYIFVFRSDKNSGMKLIKSGVLTFLWLAIGFSWLFNRADATSKVASPDEFGVEAFFQNFPTLFAIFGKIAAPIKMNALAGYDAISIVTGIIVAAAIVFLIISAGKKEDFRSRKVVFGAIWVLILMLPTFLVRLNLVEDFFDYAEHRAYVPLLGFFVIVLEILRAYKVDFRKPIPIGVAAALFVAYAIVSFSYKKDFEDRTCFWTGFMEEYPHKARGYLDLGKAYYVSGDLNKADSLYREGIKRNPENRNFYIDLSSLEIKRHNNLRDEKERKIYQIRLETDRKLKNADPAQRNEIIARAQQEIENLAARYDELRMEKLKKAESYANKALSIDPDRPDPLAYYNLGRVFYDVGDNKKAAEYFELATRYKKDYPQWFIDLGVAYFKMGESEKAIESYQKALKMRPKYALGYSNLGAAYAQNKDYGNAVAAWRKALELNPQIDDAHTNLTRYYFMSGKIDSAKMQIEAMRNEGIDPAYDVLQKLKELEGE